MRLAPAPAGSAAASIRLVLRVRRLLTVGRCLSGLLDRAAGLEAAGDRHQPLGGDGVLVDLLDALHAEILHLRSVPVPQKTPAHARERLSVTNIDEMLPSRRSPPERPFVLATSQWCPA